MVIFEPKADRDLSKLDQRFKKKVVLFIQEVTPLGVFVTEAWRSQKRQSYLRKKGLSRVITSYHQKGLAIDVAFEDDTRTKQIERELYPEDFERWREVADIAKKYGIDWGYDLWKWDKPHFQDNGEEYVDKKKSKWEKEKKESIVWAIKSKIALGWNNAPESKKEMAVMLHRFYTKYICKKKLDGKTKSNKGSHN